KQQVSAVYWSRLVAKHSSKCIAVKSRDEGTPITQQPCGGLNPGWTISAAPLPSFWGPLVTFTVVPGAAAIMANGRVVFLSAYGEPYFCRQNRQDLQYGKAYTPNHQPSSGQTNEMLGTKSGPDNFCPCTAVLQDGRILVNGGSGSSKTSIFDPVTQIW